MTRLPGAALVAPRDPAAWAAHFAGALAAIHAAPLDQHDVGFLRKDTWITDYLHQDPPVADAAWSADWVAAWSAACALWRDVELVAPTLIHGDYWSGNTLWRRGRLVGVVDWDDCGIGDPRWDVGSGRVDLAMSVGGDGPDLFLRAYEETRGTGPVRDLAFWDLVAATAVDPAQWLLGLHDLGRTELTLDLMRARLSAFIVDALGRAG
jgi:aminoglycoside phosphotransferase (APT) family kinase protein